MDMLLTLLVVSFFGGLVSGLLGIGGAVVLIPLLLSVPPLVGAGQLSMHEVAGITMIQVLVASFFSCFMHHHCGIIHRKTVLAAGIPMGVFALLGSAVSKYMAAEEMLFIFGCLVVIAFFMLLKQSSDETQAASGEVPFKLAGSVIVGGSVGLVSGIVGAGGGFILIPLMVGILKLPMRLAVGSSLGVVFIGALMGSIGKIMTLQVEWVYLIPVIAGSIPSALWGSHICSRSCPANIRYLLLAVVFLAALNTWKDIYINFTK
jgi:uncharacterized protein